MRELEGKAAGDERVFIPSNSTGLADWAPPTPMLDTAGGVGVTGAAKPDGVIHRYGILPIVKCSSPLDVEGDRSGGQVS